MNSKAEHIFRRLLAIWMSSFMRHLFKILTSFLKIDLFFLTDLQEIFIFSGHKFFIECTYCKYLLSLCSLLFHSLPTSDFCRSEILNCNTVQINSLSFKTSAFVCSVWEILVRLKSRGDVSLCYLLELYCFAFHICIRNSPRDWVCIRQEVNHSINSALFLSKNPSLWCFKLSDSDTPESQRNPASTEQPPHLLFCLQLEKRLFLPQSIKRRHQAILSLFFWQLCGC